jgi:hypothetical protein
MGSAYNPFVGNKSIPKMPIRMLPETDADSSVLKPMNTAKWRVKKSKRVSIRGCLTSVSEGQIISTVTHGEEVVLRLIDQGVEMEEVK